MIGTDRYAYLSRLRRTAPIPKLCLAFAPMLICIGCSSVAVGLATLLVMSAATLWLGGLRFGVLLHFFRVPLAFLALGCLTILVEAVPAGTPMLLALPVGGSLWGISPGGLWRGLRIFAGAMGAISCMYFLALNTPMTDLTLALEKLHVPKLFVELMELIYRFVFVLTEEMHRIRVAQDSRLGYRSMGQSFSSVGTLCSMVFLRAWRRGDRVYSALESRGYTGSLTTLSATYTPGRGLYGLALGVAALQIAVFYLERAVGFFP
ncbi:MAG: cobalt ECF transporter T component CbiQ [Pseudoflavonifractor sp.]